MNDEEDLTMENRIATALIYGNYADAKALFDLDPTVEMALNLADWLMGYGDTAEQAFGRVRRMIAL